MNELQLVLQKHGDEFHPVVEFNPAKEKLLQLDFTAANSILTDADLADTAQFSLYIENKLKAASAKFGIGGYNENRSFYRRSGLFDGEEPRSLHLGIDIWGPVGTKVYAPLGGMVHSVAFNDNFGDYGATIILQHQLETLVFHTLYGHVSLKDIAQLREGAYVSRGDLVAHFGEPQENGHWPPHLHFQVIGNLYLKEGDFPGVCKISEAASYLHNCPDADLILGMMKHTDRIIEP